MPAFLPERRDALSHVVTDTFRGQVRELLRVRRPGHPPTDAEIDAWIGPDPGARCVWWAFPWRDALVQLLPAAEFAEVRESRNRYKITRDEAQTLRRRRVAVLGLSVGQAILVTLAMEGAAGTLRFADPDTLDLSNLNRLRASVVDLGLPKWGLAARAVSEIDPYLTLEPWAEPVTPENVERFLEGVDLLVEECDDLAVKLLIRAAARRRGIPVVMHTSDRGLLDVERFDQEPARPIFHGLVGDLDARGLAALRPPEKVPVVARILGEPSMRSAVTLPEVGVSVVSWPQLAAEVAAGAGTVTDTVRRILLGEAVPSGRWVHDPDEALRAPPLYREPVSTPPPPPPLLPPGLPSPDDPVAFVVSAAALAPSAHNAQPWAFVADGERIDGLRVHARWKSRMDPTRAVLDAMLGSALENLVVAASALGRDTAVELGEGDVVWRATLTGRAAPDALAAALGERHTNRRLPDGRDLDPALVDALVAEASLRGARLWMRRPDAALGEACAAGIRGFALDPALHAEMMGQVRWTRAEVEATRDGLDLDSLELDGAQRLGMRLFSNPHVARAAGRLGIGKRIGQDVAENVVRAPWVGLLTFPGPDRAAHVAAGRALSRVWLRATLAGLSVYPMAALCELWPYALGGAMGPDAVEELRPHLDTWRRHFPLPDPERGFLLLRFAYCGPASVRSLRYPLDRVLERRS